MSSQPGLAHLAGRELLLAHHVAAVLPQSWENLAGHPILEAAGLGFVRAHDEFVEAGLGDELGCIHSFSSQRLAGYAHLASMKPGEVVRRTVLSDVEGQRLASIGGDEPRLAFDLNDSDLGGLEVEDL